MNSTNCEFCNREENEILCLYCKQHKNKIKVNREVEELKELLFSVRMLLNNIEDMVKNRFK